MKYTSEYKIVDYVRKKLGITKPYALPICAENDDVMTWDVWENNTKAERPFAYWLTETLPDYIDWIKRRTIVPLHEARYYVRNRFIEKMHYLPTGLPPGQYQDLDTRMLHAMFTGLENFVEVELAWMNVVFDDEKRAKYHVPWYRSWTGWRSKEAGLDYLKWEMELRCTVEDGYSEDDPALGQPTRQAIAAQTKWKLYWWWQQYKERSDPFELWHLFNDEMRDKYSEPFFQLCTKNRSSEDIAEGDRLFKMCSDEDNRQEQEITDMLHKLVDIRRTLWT